MEKFKSFFSHIYLQNKDKQMNEYIAAQTAF